jgi:hypothetical protein
MSRTDSHAPFAVRMLRGEVAHHAVHLCGGNDRCDLPDLEAGGTTGPGCCQWEWTFTGHNWCSCWMCHWRKRPQQRRTAVRTELRAVAREWNGGDEDAGWEV